MQKVEGAVVNGQERGKSTLLCSYFGIENCDMVQITEERTCLHKEYQRGVGEDFVM